jgi:hypothetical protein
LRILIALILLVNLVACTRTDPPPAPPPSAEASKETGLERIPEPDRAKYPRLQDMAQWRNPQLVVREDGIGLVDRENHEIHILTPEQVPAELVSLSETAWPYGRVVLVTQAASTNTSEQSKAKLRENRGLLIGTLKELQVQIREAP